jgi:four helix bundle protein
MGKVERFEDLIAWQKARDLTREIYAVTRRGTFARDFALRDQIQRASVSVMANLAEGFERGKRTEFHQFACTSKASCGEVRSHLYVALDAGHIEPATFDDLYARADEVGRIIGGLRLSLEQPGTRRR